MNQLNTDLRVNILLPRAVAALLIAVGIAGCNPPDPESNTPTSGTLILYVDEAYAELIGPLADTFMVTNPNATVEVRTTNAHDAIGQMFAIHQQVFNTDTSLSVAAIIGRRLVEQEQASIDQARYEIREYLIGYDGLVFAVPNSSPIRSTVLGWVRRAINEPSPTMHMLDSNASYDRLRFLLPDQNSSTFPEFRRHILGDSNIAGPVRYYSTIDSVVDAAAAGEGVAVLGWFRAHRDSARLRTLELAYVDTGNGQFIGPVSVHPTTLVTDTYPLKSPLVGYSFASPNSLANGFLTWIARSGVPQEYITHQGLQSENIRYQILMDE